MSNVPADLKYTDTHQWVRTLPDGTIEIGVTDFAQEALGPLVSVQVPQVGRSVKAGEACAVVESAKTTSDVYSPVAGAVTAANPKLAAEPDAVNSDAYGCWLMRIRPAPGALAAATLLNAAEYTKLVEAAGA
jgi:glycine cleavage system H protein